MLAKLGIPDLLKSGPKTAEELASATNMHAPSLFRVLRALASIGVVGSTADGRFALSPVSELLVTDAPGSLRWFTISELGQEHFPAWGNLLHSSDRQDSVRKLLRRRYLEILSTESED